MSGSLGEQEANTRLPNPGVVRRAVLILLAALAAQTPIDVSIEAGQTLLAQLCGVLPVSATACAGLTDGNVIDETEVDRFEQSWVWEALRRQDRLDDGEPLAATLWAHTHNSFNSTAYLPSLSNIDPNQRYSILDQLRMGIRFIELDVHWFGGRVVLCHGQAIPVALVTIHLGCSIDRPLADGLAELRAFLDAPGNEDEVVLLYLENKLDGLTRANDLATDDVIEALGPLVHRPPVGEPCADLPLDRTTDEIRAAGARVVIVGNCGPGAWGTWVHQRGPGWDEGTWTGAPPACTDEDRWTRVYEDSTWLSAMAYGPGVPVDVEAVRAMVRCGVDAVGFDRLEPFDGRLEALVWSWAPGEPVDDPARRCVGSDGDGRFRTAPCDEVRRYACLVPGGGPWIVPEAAGPAAGAAAACQNVGAVPATPPTGWENERLRAAAGPAPVWLPLHPTP